MSGRPWWEPQPAAPSPPWWSDPPKPTAAPSALPGMYGSDSHADASEQYLRDLLSRLQLTATTPR